MTLTVYESIQRIDALIQQEPPSDFKEVLALIQNPIVDAYFFNKLSRVDWLALIEQHRLLNDDGIDEHPYRLNYLKKLIPNYAEEVCDLLKGYSYKNIQTRLILVDILTVMPADFMRPLLPKLYNWEPEFTPIDSLVQLVSRALNEPSLSGLDWFLTRLLLRPTRQEGNSLPAV